MKVQLILSVALSISAALGLSSCSKDEPQQSPKIESSTSLQTVHSSAEERSLENLALQLDAYNALHTPPASQQRPRSFWSFLKKVVAVISADATGALNGNAQYGERGGIVVGILSSITMAVEGDATTKEKEEETNNWLYVYSQKASFSKEEYPIVSRLHNDVIQNLLKRYPNLYKMSENEILEILFANIPETPVRDDKYSIPNLSEADSLFMESLPIARKVVGECKNILNTPYRDPSLKTPVQDMLERSTDLGKSKAGILAGYVSTLAEIEDPRAMTDYLDGFNQIIKRSSVSASFKEDAKLFTSVATSSRLLWDVH